LRWSKKENGAGLRSKERRNGAGEKRLLATQVCLLARVTSVTVTAAASAHLRVSSSKLAAVSGKLL